MSALSAGGVPASIVVSIGSDIGFAVASRLLGEGVEVVGTYRTWREPLEELEIRGARLFEVDVSNSSEIVKFIGQLRDQQISWENLVIATGSLEPIGAFLSSDVDAWKAGIALNGLTPPELLHRLYPLKASNRQGRVVLFAGGGTNGTFDSYSAYCLGKILLIKFAELIESECADLTVTVVGTGWVKTKIHEQTLRAGELAGANFNSTKAFLRGGERETQIDLVVDGIVWCLNSRSSAIGGRNIALADDPWRDRGDALIAKLEGDPNMYRMRRSDSSAGEDKQ